MIDAFFVRWSFQLWYNSLKNGKTDKLERNEKKNTTTTDAKVNLN